LKHRFALPASFIARALQSHPINTFSSSIGGASGTFVPLEVDNRLWLQPKRVPGCGVGAFWQPFSTDQRKAVSMRPGLLSPMTAALIAGATLIALAAMASQPAHAQATCGSIS
jgi:hypothetical protein